MSPTLLAKLHTRGIAVCACLILVALTTGAGAHPLSRGALDVVVHADRVAVTARVTVEEVIVTDLLTNTDAPPAEKKPPAGEMYKRHAHYLAQHLHLAADGTPRVGRVVAVQLPTTQPGDKAMGPDEQHAVYTLEYPTHAPGDSADADSARPREVRIDQNVLVGVEFVPGTSWEASYVVNICVAGGPVTQGLLLTANQPLAYTCAWDESQPGAASDNLDGSVRTAGPAARVNRLGLIRDYLAHGVHHILTGYDHLLFISALVLAAVSVWDLVKVVSAFTLAHTLTLTLASLRLVHVPGWIVEPMIAGSIVFVALQNVVWPRQTRGWGRLAVAFGFGLFHGLGFAGGLLDAMQAMSGLTIVLAIAAFSVGVEVGHQMIVLPLFAALKLARRSRSDHAGRDRVTALALRYGSAAICLAGTYYLVAALGSALAIARHS